MPSKTLRLTCPCCNARLNVDADTGQILLAEKPPEAKREFSLEAELERVRKQKDESDEIFNKAFRDEAERRKLLDRKFEEAQKRAQEDKDAPLPPRPFDFD